MDDESQEKEEKPDGDPDKKNEWVNHLALIKKAGRFPFKPSQQREDSAKKYTEEELLAAKDLPALLNMLQGLPPDAGPKFGQLAGATPVDEKGKPRFFTLGESLERQIKRQGGMPMSAISVSEVIYHQTIIQKWMRLHQSQKENGPSSGDLPAM